MSPALQGCKGRAGDVFQGWLCLYNLSGGFLLCHGGLRFIAGHYSLSLQSSQTSFQVIASGEAAGRSMGPLQRLRHRLHPWARIGDAPGSPKAPLPHSPHTVPTVSLH